MKEAFETKKVGAESLHIIRLADEILTDYADRGYTVTLRQLFYRFLSKKYFPATWIDVDYNIKNNLDRDTLNTQKNYKRLGEIVLVGRNNGLIDWNHMEDRGRTTVGNSHWDNPGQIVRAAANGYRIDKWEDQPCWVTVMVEKQALEGVLVPVCNDLDIPFCANKGYSSASALYGMARNIAYRRDRLGKQIHVIYLGDHDPSGIDMSRDIEQRLRTMSRGSIHVHRIALNMDQIEAYNLIEDPAKVTDSRAKGYIDIYGDKSWELDALEPELLDSLVRLKVGELRDDGLFAARVEKERQERDILLSFASTFKDEPKPEPMEPAQVRNVEDFNEEWKWLSIAEDLETRGADGDDDLADYIREQVAQTEVDEDGDITIVFTSDEFDRISNRFESGE
jgi:hypothetical protein